MTARINTYLVATAQVVISIAFLSGYFWLLHAFMSGGVKVPAEYKDAFVALLGVLTAGVGLILSFWFSRQRPSGNNNG